MCVWDKIHTISQPALLETLYVRSTYTVFSSLLRTVMTPRRNILHCTRDSQTTKSPQRQPLSALMGYQNNQFPHVSKHCLYISVHVNSKKIGKLPQPSACKDVSHSLSPFDPSIQQMNYVPRRIPSSTSRRTKCVCSSMKKSGRPTSSASPRALRLIPALPSGPRLLPDRNEDVGVLPWVAGLRSLARDSCFSSSASASPWIQAASSRKAVDRKEKVCIARRSRCVLRAMRA